MMNIDFSLPCTKSHILLLRDIGSAWSRLLVVALILVLQVLVTSGQDSNATDEWSLHHVKGVMKNQYLYFRNLEHPTNPHHSCYRVRCEGNACPTGEKSYIDICYPAIIVTGLPKCGTSALYDLLTRYPKAIRMPEKENCPYTRRRPHWIYFQSLPRMSDVDSDSLIVDGCIDTTANLNMRDILRGPKTLYIVLTRNYADMVWSSYNFWCNWLYDGVTCDSTRWVKIGIHVRSPEIFHDIVQGDSNGTLLKNPLHDIKRPCVFGGGFYSEYLSLKLWLRVPRNQTLAIASEHLEEDPDLVWTKITTLLGMRSQSVALMNVGNFSDYRYNTQDNRGTSKEVSRDHYRPGVFPISNYRPMFNETREILDRCWKHDCIMISQITGYLYPVCQKELMELIALGQFKSFNDIYKSNKYEFKSNLAETIHF